MHPGIWLPMLLLIVLGLSFVHSTTSAGTSRFLLRQVSWTAVGSIVFILLWRARYRDLLSMAPLFYGLTIAFLLAVLLFGKSRGISQSWLSLGPFTLQPSEFAKLGLVLILARCLGSVQAQQHKGRWSMLLIGLGLAALPVLLVLAQPDLGTALVFVPIILIMLWIAGAKTKHLILLMLTGLLLLPVAFTQLKEYQKDRLLVFLNPDKDPLGAGYNILQSKIAVGSGGVAGKGYGMGTQNRLKFLPERHTDFIFSIISEETGWWGGVLLLTLFFILLASAVQIAKQAQDMQAKLLVVGLAVMLFAHVFINVGVSLGIMPATGIPLPFVSYGGSSLVTCMAAMAIILNVHAQRYRFS